MSYRNAWCGEVLEDLVGTRVALAGWVHRRRDHGGLVFVDLRDRTGLVQLVFDPAVNERVHETAHRLRSEFVVSAEGTVVPRGEERVNPNMKTGHIEIAVDSLTILAEAKTPPFTPGEFGHVDDNTRLRYRYIDLRRSRMQENLRLRDAAVQSVRRYFGEHGFLEIETPILTKSTPEGARDFLVPSRLQPGAFYALPQSPQLFKQLLMIAGYERYYQLARAFRDEDLRADRQPEHTQIDLEMSFVEERDIQELVEGMMVQVFRDVLDIEVPRPFPRLTYAEAMRRFGSDKPDVRFGLEIIDISELVSGSGFKVFADTVARGGAVRGICVPGAGAFSRKDVDDLAAAIAPHGAKGLVPVWVEAGGIRSPIAKFLSVEVVTSLLSTVEAQPGDILLLVADERPIVEAALGALRLHLAEKLSLEREGWEFLWIIDPPMFEWDEKEKRLKAQHHPFTKPRVKAPSELAERPLDIGTYAYDLVLNGVELGSGSLRIADPALQEAVFEALGLSAEEIEGKFGFLVEAMDYGIPPHGGMAMGLDRLVMLMAGEKSIREVIAFPKTQSGGCPLTAAPSGVAVEQLRELRIRPL